MFQESESIAVNESCNEVLKRLIPDLESKESLFASTSNGTVVEGSYILTMPTANGRSAQVIFAPGEESLEGIKYMLGKDNTNNVEIRKLERFQLIDRGQSCRFLSRVVES